jgi:hypothetical protein
MVLDSTQDHTALSQLVSSSLQKAQGQVSGLRKTNTRLVGANVICSTSATLVAGLTAATGPIVGAGIEGWRISCIVAAILAFISTVSIGFIQQLKFEERLMQGNQCVGRLRELNLSIATGSRSWDEITKEYTDIMKTYPEHIG